MEQFEQLLTCAICLDRYRNPKLLPCQHSFCMEPCMDGLVDYVRRQVKCPECRAEHRIPYQGVQAFPTNVTLQRFLELHIEITGELPDPTSGQTMERCGVCSEKSYCSLCVHCEKKCCPECKDAHMDILRREITRINSQVRRGLHRLQDALALVEKNTLGLQTNCASVGEEVDEIYRRLSKALKDRTEHLRNEVDRYLGTELRGLIQLKENLELEIANIQSNCDLAEAHINENVPWDDAELLDTKELFLRTVEFIRNFEYEAGDYNRRVRFVMAHDPNQLVLHVAGYGELNIKPEAGSGGLLGSTGGLAPPGGSPGLMRSKSDHRLASQYRQQEEERLARNRYVPEYEYDAPEYEAPRNKSRYRSRFMRHRDGDDSDGDTRSTVRFTSTQEAGSRERVLDTEDAARGPLSGIFRLTDSPRVMKKLQECERAGKRKKDEPAQPTQPAQPAPKSQVQVRKAPTAVARQVSEDDEISRIKKQNKNAPTPPETVEERQPSAPTPVHTPTREHQERETEELVRRTPITRRTSADTHPPTTRSASSDSSTGSESSTGSGIRSTGAPFTAEEMKQKYLSRAPAATPTTTVTSSPAGGTANRETTTTPANRPFQSRFLGAGNRAAPLPPSQPVREDPPAKKDEEEEDEDETSSSSEETETETEEESETDQPSTATSAAQSASQERSRTESAMARTDIGPLLARSAEARRGSKEDSPSTRYSTPRGSPALPATSPTGTTTMTTPTPTGTTGTAAPAMTTTTTPSSYTSRTFSPANDQFSRLPKEPGVTLSRSTPGPDQGTTSGTSSNASEHGGIPSASRPSSSEPKVTPSTSPSDQSLTEDLLSDCTDHPDEPKTLNNSIHQNSMVSHNDARAYKHSESLPNDAHRFLDLGSDEIHGRGEHTRLPIDAENFEVIEEDEEDEEESDSEEDDNCNTIILVESDEGSKDRSSQSITTLNGETNNPVVEEEDSEDQHDFHENGPNTNYDNFQDDEEEDSSDEEVEEVEDEEDEEEDNDTNKTTLRNNLENRESGLSTNDDNVNHYDLSLKRRSGSSIFEEKSIEELFDDNGWVVTDQDLQLDKPRIHTIKLEEGSGQGESVNHNDETESEKTETNDQTSEAKHNSETEPIDKETSTLRRIPQETGFDRDVRLVLEEPDRFAEKHKEQNHIFEQPRNILINAISNMLSPSISVTDENSVDLFINDKTLEESEKLEKDEEFSMDDKWMIDDNGWVILKGVGGLKSEMGEGKEVDLETGLNVERGIENGAVTNAKEIGRTDEDASGVALSIPMQMVPEQESEPSSERERDRERERERERVRERERERDVDADVESPLSPRSRYAALKERRQRLARSRSSHNFGGEEAELDEEPASPTTQSPNAYLAAKYGPGSELARSRSTHALKSREPSPERDRPGAEKDGAALSSWARYLKNKYGNRAAKDKEPSSSSTTSIPSSSTSASSRRLSLGLPLRHGTQTSFESSDDDQKNPSGSPTSPTAAPGTPAAAGSSTSNGRRSHYLLKRRQLFTFGMRGSEAGCFTWPRGLAVGPDNSIVVADSSNHRVQVLDANGNFMKEFGTYGSGEGEFDCLAGVAVNRIGQYIIADRYNHRIQVLDPSGRFLRAFGSQGTADGRFNYPWGITTDALGFIYVCDKENHRVQVFQSDGTFVGKFGSCGSGRGQLEHPHYIAVSNTNRVIVSDGNNHRIQIFDVNGRVLSSFGSEGSDEGQFKFPRGVAVDDQGYIIVADSGNNRIQVFSPEGTFLKAFGTWGSGDGEFKGLEGVAVTSAGNIVVCDRENHRIQVF